MRPLTSPWIRTLKRTACRHWCLIAPFIGKKSIGALGRRLQESRSVISSRVKEEPMQELQSQQLVNFSRVVSASLQVILHYGFDPVAV